MIFVHIPRTGGTTLSQVAVRQYPAGAARTLVRVPEEVEALRAAPMDEKARLRFVRGHVPFGLHELLPQPCSYITLLRHPVPRAVSLYQYVRSHPEHPHHRMVCENDVGLEGFVEQGLSGRAANAQTRLLSGATLALPEIITESELERAKAHLGDFLAVGITERYRDSITLIGATLRWATLDYTPHEVNRDPRPPVAPALRHRIEQQQALDMELYEYARRMFERQWLEYLRREAARSEATQRADGLGPREPNTTFSARSREILKQVLPYGIVRSVQRRRKVRRSSSPQRP